MELRNVAPTPTASAATSQQLRKVVCSIIHSTRHGKGSGSTSHAALSFFTLAMTTVVALPSRDVVTFRLCWASSVGMDTLQHVQDHKSVITSSKALQLDAAACLPALR